MKNQLTQKILHGGPRAQVSVAVRMPAAGLRSALEGLNYDKARVKALVDEVKATLTKEL